MPQAWVNVDLIPAAARPAAVEQALTEALDLRVRLREAQEEQAAAQAELERLEHEDVAAAAERIRSGVSPGAIPPTIAKTRQQLELANRNASALGLASEAAQHDLVQTIREHGGEWLAGLDKVSEQARTRGRKALAALEAAVGDVAAAASATAWVRSGLGDGRFDRRPPVTTSGTVAQSSARVTANSEALRRDQVIGFVAELIDPPEPPARVPMRASDAASAA